MNDSLRKLEEQFISIFKFAPMGMVLLNKEGTVIRSNPALQNLLGYTEEEFKNLHFPKFINSGNGNYSFNLFREMLAGERTNFSQKQQIFRKNGESFWGDLSVHTVCDANGFIQYAIATIQNLDEQPQPDLQEANAKLTKHLTEQANEIRQTQTILNHERLKRQNAEKALILARKLTQALLKLYPNTILTQGSFAIVTNPNTLEAMESELQQTKEQLRAVLDAMPGFVCWVSSEGKYLGVNQYMADTFNLSPDDFVGKELSFLKNSPEFAQFMVQFLADSTPTGHHVVEARVNGSTRHYLINCCSEILSGFSRCLSWN
jgi:PAS domain S-box-containing protein